MPDCWRWQSLLVLSWVLILVQRSLHGLYLFSGLRSICQRMLFLCWPSLYRLSSLVKVTVSLSVNSFLAFLSYLWGWLFCNKTRPTWARTPICWLLYRTIRIWDSFPFCCSSWLVLFWLWLCRLPLQQWLLRLLCVLMAGLVLSWEQHWC